MKITLAAQFAETKQQILDAHAKLKPAAGATALERQIFAAVRSHLEAMTPPEPEKVEPDPLAAGAELHKLTQAEIKASGGKLTYAAALQRVCVNNWELVRAYQASVPRD